MPIRWKKTTGCTRFPQLVADHIQSQRRGGSLVVETGFPTSLIDIYVRNRGRLRKFSRRKRRGNDSSNPLSSSSDSSIESTNSSSVASDYMKCDEAIEECVTADVDVNVIGSLSDPEETDVEIGYWNRGLVAALTVLLITALALEPKRFTTAITVSAFLLLFLESLGLFRLLRPCWDPRKLLQSRFHGTNRTTTSESNSTLVDCSEVLEVKDEKDEVADSVTREVLVDIRHKKSRRAKIKSKILKLLPKKRHASDNHCLDSKGEIPCGFKEEGPLEQSNGPKSKSLWPLLLNECSDSDGGSKEEHNKLGGQARQLNLSNGSNLDDKVLQTNSGYLVLCLVVLVGLMGGRSFAIVLAISWCLMLKMTQWRHVNLSIS